MTEAEPLVVSPRQLAWLHEFGLPGTDEALAALKARGEIVIVERESGQNHGNNNQNL